MVKLDWRSCLKEKIVKKVNEDRNRILALKRISQKKFEGANILPKQHYYSKITLLYDAIRTNLECLALENGYKIYNHQCYVPFLKEVLQKSFIFSPSDRMNSVLPPPISKVITLRFSWGIFQYIQFKDPACKIQYSEFWRIPHSRSNILNSESPVFKIQQIANQLIFQKRASLVGK